MNSIETAAGRRRLPWLLGLLALTPLLWCWRDFSALFWFGDEWDQLDSIATHGFWPWMWGCFGENFAPAFKLAWGGLAYVSGGDYRVVVVAVWLVHAICVGLLARWLLRCGLGAAASAVAVLIFALASTNIEALGWTIQLITLQGMLFFIAAAQWHDRNEQERSWAPARLAVLAVLVSLGTFSFVRGALVGLSLAGATLVLAVLYPPSGGRRFGRLAAVLAVCVIPAAVCVAVIMKFAPGNHQHLATVGLLKPVVYAVSYFFLNPFYKFFTDAQWTLPVLLGFAAVKCALLVVGFWRATPRQRRMLLPLLLFDLGNALLMGIGRSNEPLFTATSSRYQYISLVCTVPFVAVLLDALFTRLRSQAVRTVCAALLLGVAAVGSARRWPVEMPGWADARGRQTRHLLFEEPNPPAEGAIPGIPFLRTTRAKEIVRTFHLR